MLETALTYGMFHPAGVPFCFLWINTSIYQQTSEETVLLIGPLGYLSAHIGLPD